MSDAIVTCPTCGAKKDICIVCGEPFTRHQYRQVVCNKDGKRTCYWTYYKNKKMYERKKLARAGANDA